MVWALAFPIAASGVGVGGEWLLRVLAIALVFGLIVFVHEAGHFLLARMAGMAVYEFSIGFGRPLLFWFKRGETQYSFRLWPFLSYVRIAGMEPGDEDHPRGFDKKPRWVRAAVLVAGCVNNFLLAVVIFIAIGLIFGQGIATNEVGDVQKGSPAAQVGLVKGDKLIGVNGRTGLSLEAIRDVITSSPNKPITLKVDRKGSVRDISVTPMSVTEPDTSHLRIRTKTIGRIGIMFVAKAARVGVGQAIVSGFTNTAMLVQLQVAGIVSMITRDIPVQGNVMGPVGIVDMMYTQAQQSWLNFLNLAALLTVAVGFLNLVPFPPLDGSRLLILVVEWVVRRQLSKQRETVINLVGILVLLSFVFFLTIKDFQRIWLHHAGGG